MRQGEIFEWLRKLQKEGKIRNFGASVESMDEALLCIAQAGLASLQIIFNIFRQKPIETLFPQAKNKGVAIIARLPLASGLLSGKFTKDTKFGVNDHRSFNRDGQQFNVGETFAGIPFEKGVELAEEMKAFVPEGLSMVQLAQHGILVYTRFQRHRADGAIHHLRGFRSRRLRANFMIGWKTITGARSSLSFAVPIDFTGLLAASF
jgi:hypothetical protein